MAMPRSLRVLIMWFSGISLGFTPMVVSAQTDRGTIRSEHFTAPAELELAPDAHIPLPFHGVWSPPGQKCGTRPASGAVRVNADGIVKPNVATRALRIWLYPGDAPDSNHAIIDVPVVDRRYERDEWLTLQLDQSKRRLSMRQGGGELEAAAYNKC